MEIKQKKLKYIKKQCKECGEKIFSKNKKQKFCSHKCYSYSKKGMKPFHYSGGRYINVQGYILIFKPKHPNCDCRGYVREHILVIEKAIGRFLIGEEQIHHIDRDKTNNNLNNLYICNNHAEHMGLHLKLSNKKILEIKKLFKQGHTKTLLSEMFGVTRRTIANYIKIDIKEITKSNYSEKK